MLRLNNLTGFGGRSSGGGAPDDGLQSLMDSLTDESLDGNTVFCLDFSDPNCYPGSGQEIFDLSGNGNDWWRGVDSSSSSSDPTFVDAGDASYFSFDGGDTIQLQSVGAAFQGLHKNSALFSVVICWRPVAGGSAQAWFSTTSSSNLHGVNVQISSSEALQIVVRNGSGNALLETSSLIVSTGSNQFCALALDEAAGGSGSHWRRNGSTDTFDGTYSSPSTTNSSRVRISARGDGSNTVDSGTRIHAIALLDTDISTTQSGNLYTSLQSRFSF